MKTKIKPNLFTIVFEDNTSFLGGTDYRNTKWLEVPNKQIKRVFYRLPHGDFLCLSGYEEYYHMVEATKDLNGKFAGIVSVEYAYIMGKTNNKVIIYKIDLRNKENYVSRKELDINDKWVKTFNENGWK